MADHFKMLTGGLHVAIVPMHSADPIHQAALGNAFRQGIESESNSYIKTGDKPLFDNARFGKIIAAAKRKKIEARFMLAAWENCADSRIPQIVQVIVDIPTVMVKWIDGKPVVYHGKYREDTCLIPDAVKNLFRTRPKGKRFSPDVGLAHYMEQERMRDMTTKAPSNGNKIYRGTIAECASKSAQMKKVMQDVGAQVGTEEDKILELKGDKPFMHNRWQADVETQKLTNGDGSTLDYAFLTHWKSEDGKQQIVATFTDAISTFNGEPIMRVNLSSNGNLPSGVALEDIVASLLAAGKEEALKRNWGAENIAANDESPSISIHAGRKEALKSIMRSSHNEILKKRLRFPPIFGNICSTMRIHSLGEPQLRAAMEKIEGMEDRKLGRYTTQAVELDIHTAQTGMPDFKPEPAVPLSVVHSSYAHSQPHISWKLAA